MINNSMLKAGASFILTILLIFVHTNLSEAQKNPKRLYIEDENKKQVVIPFKLANNLIILGVKVNNSDTLNFILDTGVTTTIIIANNIPQCDSFKYLKEFWVNGLGEGEKIPARHSPGNEIRMKGILGKEQDLLVIKEDCPNFSKLLGIPIHGLIGYTFFKDFIVEINYDEHYIILNTPRKYIYKLKNKKQVSIPLTFYEGKPYIDAIAVQNDKTEIPLKLLVDLGVSYAVWLNLHSDILLKLPPANTQVHLGVGLNGLLTGRIGRLYKLKINRFDFQNIIVNYPDTNSLGNALKMDYRNGSVGSGLLSKFNLIMDYRNQKLTLKPNKNINEPFHYNMSGLEIVAPQPGLPVYLISYIRKNSPAERAGLKVGDQILLINKKTVSNLTLTEVTTTLLGRPGKRISIIFRRKDMDAYTMFKLEELI
jgi:hypothetical protein